MDVGGWYVLFFTWLLSTVDCPRWTVDCPPGCGQSSGQSGGRFCCAPSRHLGAISPGRAAAGGGPSRLAEGERAF